MSSILQDPGIAHIRRLAQQVAEKAADPKYKVLQRQWEAMWNLKPERPMILTRAYIFDELIDERPVSQDPLLRSIEWDLMKKLYNADLDDDEVLEAELDVEAVFADGNTASGKQWGDIFGLPFSTVRTEGARAHGFEPQIECEEDLRKLHFPDPQINEKETALREELAYEVTGGVLPIRMDKVRHWMFSWMNPAYLAIFYIGFEPLLISMIEEPEFVHAVMKFFSDAILYNIDYDEKHGLLPPANRGLFNDIPNFDSRYPKDKPAASLKQLVARADSQEFGSVSPEMTWEFLLSYQMPILDRFGTTHYGCCESFHRKFALLRKIKNLRMYTVSPWTSLQEAVDEMGKAYAIDWRVNVSDIVNKQDYASMRREVAEGMRIARDHSIAIVLQDVETLNGNKDLLKTWIRAAREGVQV